MKKVYLGYCQGWRLDSMKDRIMIDGILSWFFNGGGNQEDAKEILECFRGNRGEDKRKEVLTRMLSNPRAKHVDTFFYELEKNGGWTHQMARDLVDNYINVENIFFGQLFISGSKEVYFHDDKRIPGNWSSLPKELAANIKKINSDLRESIKEDVINSIKLNTESSSSEVSVESLDFLFFMIDLVTAAKLGADLVLSGEPPKLGDLAMVLPVDSITALKQFIGTFQYTSGSCFDTLKIDNNQVSALSNILNSQAYSSYSLENNKLCDINSDKASAVKSIERSTNLICSSFSGLIERKEVRYGVSVVKDLVGLLDGGNWKVAEALLTLIEKLLEEYSDSKKDVVVYYENHAKDTAASHLSSIISPS